jgi:uncharacterized membrane-anchored protein
MNRKNISLAIFILVALAQIYVPAKMILSQQNVLDKGTEFKFKIDTIDPIDPRRSNYISLNYDDNTINIQNQEDWFVGESVFVLISKDIVGYAIIESVSKNKFDSSESYLKAKVNWVNNNTLAVEYPFNRYHMEEFNVQQAEKINKDLQIDSNRVAYAQVSIREGKAVLKDVFVDGVSILELVVREREEDK